MNFPDLRYECLHCGYSCQTFEVKANALESRRVKRLGGEDSVQGAGSRFFLARRACGSCVFHDGSEMGGCELHREHGARSKPRSCRDFPFRAYTTEVGTFVGASFACTAILQGHGPPTTAETVNIDPRPLPPVPLAGELAFSSATYHRWEAHVLERMRAGGEAGLEQAVVEITEELGSPAPLERRHAALDILQRCLLGLAEGTWSQERELDLMLEAHVEGGAYPSRILGRTIDVALVRARWETPWGAWPQVLPFFEHLLFRKYLLEGPDVHARLCSLPTLANILQFLALAHSGYKLGEVSEDDVRWALRTMEHRLTFHTQGWEGFLTHFAGAYLDRFRLW